jgi:subtilisin family serine protease
MTRARKPIEKSFAILILLACLFSCPLPSGIEKPEFPTVEDVSVKDEIILAVPVSSPLSAIDALVPGLRVRTIARIGGNAYYLYKLNESADADSVILSLVSSGLVSCAEKNARYSLFTNVPDDPCYDSYQYAPQITHCKYAWDNGIFASGVTVAVIDTGINGEHEDFGNRVIAGLNVITGNTISAGTNSDDIGHGTHVAGIIGAGGNNGKGIAGVAWKVSLMPVKVFAPDVFTSSAFISAGIVYAVDNGADVINMSLGGGVYSSVLNDAIHYAYDHNVAVIAAMGNDSRTKLNYPAALAGVISVGSTNGRDEVSYFSTRGKHISVAAPGESIYSLSNASNNEYVLMSGTSMATPFVSGLAALLVSRNPGITIDEMRSVLEESADPLIDGVPFDSSYGYGRVNVETALNTTPVDNFGSIKVSVTNRGNPVGGVKVIIESTADLTVVQAGLTSAGSSTGGSNGEIVFNHLRLGEYRVRVQVGTARTSTVKISDASVPGEVSFAFNTPMILIVNGIKKFDNAFINDETLYIRKLTDMGKYFSIWKVAYNGPPPPELVQSYDLIIWLTGRTADDPEANIEVLGAEERDVIKGFLDSGKPMYICGNNIAEHLAQADSSFLANYLHSSFVAPSFQYEDLYGLGFIDKMDIAVTLDGDDIIAPVGDAVPILEAIDEIGTYAGISWIGNYRLVFTTVTPNQIVYCYPDNFLESVIDWLESE